jgi:hypothetical protein
MVIRFRRLLVIRFRRLLLMFPEACLIIKTNLYLFSLHSEGYSRHTLHQLVATIPSRLTLAFSD